MGSVLSFRGAWKLKTGVLPRMSYPHTSGVIKGFPHNLQRKSGTPCERKPPPSPFCSSAWRSERRGCRRPEGSAEEPLTPHSEKALSWKTPASPTRALPSEPAQPRPQPGKPWLPRAPLVPGSHRGPVLTSAPFPRSPTRSPADLTGLNTQRGQPSNSWHRSALQKQEKCCVDFAGSLQHLGEVTALPFSSPRYT